MSDVPALTSRFYQPWQAMRDIVAGIATRSSPNGRILDIGPGWDPFAPATEFVEWQSWPNIAGRKVYVLDINQEPLPFDDQAIDFVYCRHTLEDIYNPVWLCKEMNRVAKAGYVETPSPMAELTRGVEPGNTPWRGYIHHRYIMWDDDGVLAMVAKAPMIEHLSFTGESDLVRLLDAGPLHWNTYFFWEDELKFRLLQHDQDFKLQRNYHELLARAAQKSFEANQAMAARFGLEKAG